MIKDDIIKNQFIQGQNLIAKSVEDSNYLSVLKEQKEVTLSGNELVYTVKNKLGERPNDIQIPGTLKDYTLDTAKQEIEQIISTTKNEVSKLNKSAKLQPVDEESIIEALSQIDVSSLSAIPDMTGYEWIVSQNSALEFHCKEII